MSHPAYRWWTVGWGRWSPPCYGDWWRKLGPVAFYQWTDTYPTVHAPQGYCCWGACWLNCWNPGEWRRARRER